MNQANQHLSFASPTPEPPRNQQQETISKPRKLRRISRACDFCHKRSIRCKPSTEHPLQCQNCLDFGVGCTYNRPAKKRGIKTGTSKSSGENGNGSSSRDGESDARMLLELTNGVQGSKNFNVVESFLIPEKWETMVLANEKKIQDLVEVYFEVVYPIFPLFHFPIILRRLASREHLTDLAFFANIMTICAISSARAGDGALFPGRWAPDHFENPSSESFFAAAKEALPQELGLMKGLDWMRTCAMLALFGIQIGKIDIMHQYLGMYHSIVAMDSLHDEKNWPKGIGIVEIELRRRLFWSMYTLEVYSSIVWGSIIRCRESQSHVSYPSEVDDEFFADSGYHPPNCLVSSFPTQGITNPISWLHGWNFTTELYRILEHVMDDFHRRRPSNIGPSFAADLFGRDIAHQNIVLNKVMSMHEDLPARFKETKLVSQNGKGGLVDKFSFQAANITATLQLVRMILFTAEEASVDEKCAIARDLLEGFSEIPVFFLRAISSPLLHHLAGIGSILGSVMEGPLSETSYLQVREVLLAMSNLLASLEIGITRNVGAASRLRNQITNIDNYMSTQRQQDPQNHQSYNFSTQTTGTTSYPNPHSHSQHPQNNYFIKPEFAPTLNLNPNIDPALQNSLPTPSSSSGPSQVQAPNRQTFQAPYDYTANINASAGSVNAVNEMTGQQVPDETGYRLPPELLEGWPWNLDIAQGFVGGFW